MTEHVPPPPPPYYPPPGIGLRREPGPSVGWAAGLWVLAGMSLVGTLLCGAMGAYALWTSHHMEADGITTTALVTRVDPDDDVTLEYTTSSGRVITAEILWMPSNVPDVDDEVMITYDPDDLSYVIPEGSNEDRVMGTVFLIAAGVGFVISLSAMVGAILVHRARSRNAKAFAAGWI